MMINKRSSTIKWLILLAPIWVGVLATFSLLIADKVLFYFESTTYKQLPVVFVICFVLLLITMLLVGFLITYVYEGGSGVLVNEFRAHWIEYVFLIVLVILTIVIFEPKKEPFIYDNIIEPPKKNWNFE